MEGRRFVEYDRMSRITEGQVREETRFYAVDPGCPHIAALPVIDDNNVEAVLSAFPRGRSPGCSCSDNEDIITHDASSSRSWPTCTAPLSH